MLVAEVGLDAIGTAVRTIGEWWIPSSSWKRLGQLAVASPHGWLLGKLDNQLRPCSHVPARSTSTMPGSHLCAHALPPMDCVRVGTEERLWSRSHIHCKPKQPFLLHLCYHALSSFVTVLMLSQNGSSHKREKREGGCWRAVTLPAVPGLNN